MALDAEIEEQPAALKSDPQARMHDVPEALSGMAGETLPGMAAVDAELRQDAVRCLRQAVDRTERFLRRPGCALSDTADPTRMLCSSLCAEAHKFLRGPLSRRGGLIPSEHTLRSAYRLAGALRSLVSSNAPSVEESTSLCPFPPAEKRDAVAYARYGSEEIVAQESAYIAMLGIDAKRARLLLTSSGMAAYALIETFLLREVLESGDRILLNPGIYFETRHQLQSLPFLDVTIAGGGSREDTLEALAEHRPRVVFVDPLTNSSELRFIDLPRLLDAADAICGRETWFVVDGTLLSGSFDPFAKSRRFVRILYYESGCKYLQLGADLGPTGVVVVESALAARFEHWRRGIGAISTETLALPRISRNAYLGFLRQQTTCARVIADSVLKGGREGAPVIECSFPSEPAHPDFAEAQRCEHLGGVIALRFLDARLNFRRPLERFIGQLIAAARVQGVPLTSGVSFGFRVPRVGAAWISYDRDEAFLRLSAGVCVEVAGRLGRLLVDCAHRVDWAGSA
jgi:cystathionine beta-lyase/cystathionine gamma-synthase